jgi:hypothetical protein
MARAWAVAKATLAEVDLTHGFRLWLEAELANLATPEPIRTVDLTRAELPGREPVRADRVERTQVRIVARAERLASEAARALAAGDYVRAATLYGTVVELAPGHAEAEAALKSLNRVTKTVKRN